MSQNFNTTEILSTVQISGKSQTFSLFYDEICHHEICLSFLNRFSRVLMTITAFHSLWLVQLQFVRPGQGRIRYPGCFLTKAFGIFLP